MANSRSDSCGKQESSEDDADGDGVPSSRSQLGFLTLDDFNVKGKRVLVRLDINSPVDEATLRLEDGSKVESAVPTVKELLDRMARVTILAHQGRPGEYDFITLNEHAEYLSRFTGKRVRFVNDIFGPHAQAAVDSLGDGECVLLQNVRNFSGEQLKLSPQEHARSALVTTLAPRFDLFVNDAFASSHRSHASLVGFTAVLPSAAGRLMEREIKALSEVIQKPSRPSTYIFGGTKFADALPVIRRLAESDVVDHILVAGLAGFAYQWILGELRTSETADHFRKVIDDTTGENARALIEKHGDKISLPIDGAVADEGARKEYVLEDMPEDASMMDIGSGTIQRFVEIIEKSRTILLSGPPGVYEREEFSTGTRMVYEAIASSDAFSVIGGGHSGAAASKLGMRDRFSYISTGGGAIERMIMGKKMPVIEALREAAGRH